MILVFGEILLDVYKQYNKKVVAGAPFNFAFHLSLLEQLVVFISKIGNDDDGKNILEFLSQKKFDTSNIQIDSKNPTGSVDIKLQNGVPAYNINNNVAYDYIDFDEIIFDKISDVKMIYIGSLIQRCAYSAETFKKIYSKFNNVKYFYDVNLRKDNINENLIKSTLELSDFVKMNEEELEHIAAFLNYTHAEQDQKILQLSKDFNITTICVTKGAKGSLLFHQNNYYTYNNPKEDFLIDTVGAGDAYSAILAIGLLNNWDPHLVIERASLFAKDICNILGAVPDDLSFYLKYKDLWNLKKEHT